MKRIFFISMLCLCISAMSFGQQADEKEVAATIETIKNAIVDADRNTLEAVMADGLVYGHSNGRVQNKVECINEIVTKNPIDYTSVTITDQTIKIIGNTAVVRHIYAAETLTNGTPGNLKIGNMMVLQKQDGKWKLIARQAYKLQ
jgi:uncharacterized protein (TIGR02246 family)